MSSASPSASVTEPLCAREFRARRQLRRRLSLGAIFCAPFVAGPRHRWRNRQGQRRPHELLLYIHVPRHRQIFPHRHIIIMSRGWAHPLLNQTSDSKDISGTALSADAPTQDEQHQRRGQSSSEYVARITRGSLFVRSPKKAQRATCRRSTEKHPYLPPI